MSSPAKVVTPGLCKYLFKLKKVANSDSAMVWVVVAKVAHPNQHMLGMKQLRGN